MAHGGPDYGVGAPVSTIYKMDDLSELAARLGSIVTHDRRGDVIAMLDFEGGLAGWGEVALMPGAAVSLSTTYCKAGMFSLKGDLPNTDAAEAGVYRYFALPTLTRIGIEWAWSTNGSGFYMGCESNYHDLPNLYSPGIRYDTGNDKLEVYQSGDTWTEVGEKLVKGDRLCFNIMKLVFDMETGLYARAILNESIYDLSGYSIPYAGNGVGPALDVKIFALQITGGGTPEVYIDDIIITQNEP